MKVKLTKAQKVKLGNSSAVFKIMHEVLMRERLFDRTKEHFWIVCLANNNQLLLIELISFGSSRATVVEPTEVFSFALQKQAAQLIMVHNHPGGSLAPSFSDKELTEKMGAIGKFVKLPVIDHLIITEESYYSFADSGLLKQIMDNTRYDLTFSQIDKLKWEMENIERRAKRNEEKLKEKENKIREIAKGLLKKKISVAEIVNLTGLSKKEVEKLKK